MSHPERRICLCYNGPSEDGQGTELAVSGFSYHGMHFEDHKTKAVSYRLMSTQEGMGKSVSVLQVNVGQIT